jgi:hypothetical protein
LFPLKIPTHGSKGSVKTWAGIDAQIRLAARETRGVDLSKYFMCTKPGQCAFRRVKLIQEIGGSVPQTRQPVTTHFLESKIGLRFDRIPP